MDRSCFEKSSVKFYQRWYNSTAFQIRTKSWPRGPISVHLFIPALEIFFYVIKTNQNIERLDIFEYSLLYSAYEDDATFFLKNKKSIMELLDTIDCFPIYFGLYSNIFKCNIAPVGALKGVQVAVCGLKYQLEIRYSENMRGSFFI